MPVSANEAALDTALSTNATFTFPANITETTPPPTTTGATLNGDNFTLTGDGSAAALSVGAGTVSVNNLSITNTGSAAAITIAAGGTVVFGDAGNGMGGDFSGGGATGVAPNLGNVSAAITGAGSVQINGAFQNNLAEKFSAADSYSGSTTIEANGKLVFGANGSINNSGTATGATVTIAGMGLLDVSGAQTSAGGATTLILNNLADAGAITLGANSISTTGTSTIAGAGVTGTGGLTVTSGTTTVTGTEAYTGSTRVFGTLDVGTVTAASSLAASSNVSLKASGATVDLTNATGGGAAATSIIHELTGVAGSKVVLGGNTLEVIENATAASFSGTITGTGGLTVAEGATPATTFELTLAGANSYSGATVIDQGAIVGLSGTGTLGAGPTAAGAGGVPAATTGSLLTLEGTLDISQLTTGSFTIGAFTDPTDTGSVELGANRLIVHTPTGAAAATADTLATVLDGGLAGGAGGSLQVGTVAGETPAAGTTPASADPTTLTLTGASTYTGSTVVYGHLIVDGSISDSSNVSLKVAGASVNFSGAVDDATFFTTSDVSSTAQTEGGVLINELTGVAGTTVTLPTFSPLIINETTNASFSGAISGGEGYGIVVRGPATLTLDGANTYAGETLVKGHLDLGAGGSIANSTVYDNGVFDVSGVTGGATTVLSLEGDNANATVLLGASTLVVSSDGDTLPGQTYLFDGTISGTGGSLTVADGGYVALAGMNTYTGATTVDNDGYLELASGSINSTSAIVNNGVIEIDASGAQTTLAVPTVVISGTGEVDFVGYTDAGGVREGNYTATPLTATISLAETYSGETYVDNVDLVIASGGSITNSFVELSGEDGQSTLDISGAGGAVTIAGLSGDNNDTAVILGSNTLILSGVGGGGSSTFNGVISGGGGIQLNSAVVEVFTQSQTYTGSTVVYGTLELEGTARLASSNVSLKAVNGTGGTLDISGATGIAASPGATPTVTVTELTGQFGSHVNLGGNTLEVTETVAASFGGVIADGTTADATTEAAASTTAIGGLTVDGSVFLTLTNAETYTGLTTVNGDLALGTATGASGIGSIATSSGLVDDGIFSIVGGSATVSNLSGTGIVKIGPAPDVLTVTETATTTFSGTIHGAGILDVAGNHTLVLSGTTSDYSGGTELTGTGSLGTVGGAATVATLELTALGAAGSGAITFESGSSILQITNAALTGGGTATESFANTITFANTGGGNYVDLTDLAFETANSGAAQTFTVGADGSLAIHEGNVTATFHLGATAAGETFTAVNDGTGHTAFHMVG